MVKLSYIFFLKEKIKILFLPSHFRKYTLNIGQITILIIQILF